MTRSEEELSVAKQSKEVGRARLVKRVVTDDINATVPVRHEEVRVEREAITDANRAQSMDGAEITEGEHEWCSENKKVSETVRKEEIDVDSDKPVKQ